MTMTLIPVRITEAHALHLGDPTGKGYKALCGRELAGGDVEVPMPRFPRSRRHVEAYWVKCWDLEVVCIPCSKRAERI